MKNKILTLVLLLGLFSCGKTPPVINNENKPFVVGQIDKYSSTHSIYYKETISTQNIYIFCSWYEAIILPTGMFNIGDTIRIYK